MELNSYLEQLEEQIRNRKAKDEVIEEIRNHIAGGSADGRSGGGGN